ncbi:DddA-like double-stranded DNA deaminase toxin [Actinopolyspora mortivallis]|uniref:DddA-like double-stranded DNA deaminase toxin n=1 Tax=Actinopolyspora mortivallis TaxID=33906 RepID=UPI0003A1215F|nr:DddA-like double-stranded DNA deaminase toxin [Actinopolyspora mortivallis]
MSSLEKLGEQLALVLAKLAESQTALAHARQRIGESGQTLAAIVDEHTHPDLSAGIPAYREAWSTTSATSKTLVSVDKAIRAYMTSIGAPGAESVGPPDDEASPAPAIQPSFESRSEPTPVPEATEEGGNSPPSPDQPLPTWVSEERVEQVRASLPRGTRGTQTVGWWLGPGKSAKRVCSGPDDDPASSYKRAERLLQARFPDDPGVWALARHAEVKVAVEMLDNSPGDEVFVLDREVCGRERNLSDEQRRRLDDERATCDQLLPFILKAGASLTAVEHDSERARYVGREPS